WVSGYGHAKRHGPLAGVMIAPFNLLAAMSALPPKADIDQHGHDVRFVPKADIEPLHSITSSARVGRRAGEARRVCCFEYLLDFRDCWTGRSAGLAIDETARTRSLLPTL